MRRVIWLVVLVALVWSGWWVMATLGAVRGIEGWLAARQSEGWQAETSAIAFEGYPLDIRITLKDPLLADPDTGVALETSALRLGAPVWDPGQITLVLPNDPILLASPETRTRFLTQEGRANLFVDTGAALALEQMEASADVWLLDGEAGDLLSGGTSRAAVVHDPEMPATYHFNLDVDGLRPGEIPRSALFIPQEWPVTFDRLSVQSTVRFDRIWDITALEVSRPQPRQISIPQAEAIWGDLQLRFAANLDVDVAGAATGSVNVQARNWRAMLAIAETAGILPSGLRPQIEQALSTLASLAGNPETLDVTLTLRDGFVSLGFIPLGPAPRFRLR
ncbi:DUF2125 domain-containing protein [Roseobacter sp. YSTF-M11]|uniref:DUF2125 domain-containing protein n=1 Tax=Roseobacter insulae TaxID=2859783 RepID=A0A9X1G0T4_9RHOB|nr:DUF2125 domain-containing protein [Roseobacter insulae]MBW4710590.1 DUF2125 domain-containing protein [Roseobacter insulae]